MNNIWAELSLDSKGQLIEYYKNLKSSSNKDFLEDLFGKENLSTEDIKNWQDFSNQFDEDCEIFGKLDYVWHDLKGDFSESVVKKILATLKISKIIELGYEKVTLDEFRSNDSAFFVIWARNDKKIEVIESYDYDDLLTFRSYDEAKEFLNNNINLLKDYFQIN